MGSSPYRGHVERVDRVDRCVACGAELGVGRFCLNCGHPVGVPAPAVVEHPPIAPPVQAADPTPVAPTSPPDLPPDEQADFDEPDEPDEGLPRALQQTLDDYAAHFDHPGWKGLEMGH